MAELVPSYIDMNFDTIKSDIQDKMSVSPVFRDYKNDASNITILIELMAYLGELNSYYLNKIAKNVYLDTADIRENIVRLGYLVGYYPKGFRSSRTDLTITISTSGSNGEYGCQVGDTIRINTWKEVKTDNETKYNNEVIYFTTTNDVFHYSVTAEDFENGGLLLTVPVSQGRLNTSLSYYGRELIDETIYLPTLNFGYDDDLTDEYPSLELIVNGTPWTRVDNFYEEVSGLRSDEDDDNVYVFRYNKYSQNVIRFSNIRNVPGPNDLIELTLIETLGVNGDVAANTITDIQDTDLVTIVPQFGNEEIEMAKKWYTITNLLPSTGGLDAETNDEMKDSIQGTVNSQFRCVTRSDYVNYLESHNDVKRAIAWGEKESAGVRPPLWNADTVYALGERVRPAVFRGFIFFCFARTGDFKSHETTEPVWTGMITGDTIVDDQITWKCIEYQSSLGGNILEYNKVYLSLLPNSWDDTSHIVNEDGVYVVSAYTPQFLSRISTYLEPRKMLCAYEEYKIPDLIFFRFDISIKIKRNFRFINVREDVRNKLIYYFSTDNRKFGETISFMDIHNFIMDTSKVSSTDTFPNIRGVYHLTIRNIDFYLVDESRWRNPYTYENPEGLYPQWNVSDSEVWEENTLKDVLLFFDQYPMLSIVDCNIAEDF